MNSEIINKKQNLYLEEASEQLVRKMYLKEMLNKIQEKIESNDEAFVRALKHYLSEDKEKKYF